jgi:hypothetical protein
MFDLGAARSAVLALAAVAVVGCERGWTEITPPYPEFEVREVVGDGNLMEQMQAGAKTPAGASACEGVEFFSGMGRLEPGPISYAKSRDTLKRCAALIQIPEDIEAVFESVSVGSERHRLRFVAKRPVIAGSDLRRARLVKSGDRASLDLEITPDASRRFLEFTRTHLGGYAAIMVNGHVATAPRITAAVETSVLHILVFDPAAGEAELKRLLRK